MHMTVRSLGALALLALGGCTTPQQLADEGRLREASQAVEPSDDDALAHVATAVARDVVAEVVLCPLDDGLLAELHGDVASAQTHYEAALATQRTDFIEFTWAKARLEKR